MNLARSPALLLFSALMLPALGGTADAQSNSDGFKRCGAEDLVLVFMNPDLQPQEDGFIHASGLFFIQFQARGERAFDIETFKFSFGKEMPAETCDTPEWITGGYLKNFRADYDPRDGFFVPINTCNVPDGEYAAAVSAYDKDMNELVRYYSRAIVENGEGRNTEERCRNPDTIKPWPMVLPGDGERTDHGQGLYIEVGEPVSEIQAWVNGARVQLTEGMGPPRDDDMVPDLGYTSQLRETRAANSQLATRQYPAFTWDGTIRAGDVVKVHVVDAWGNEAEKVVHLGDPTIGGRVTLAAPEFDLVVPETDKTADANGTAVYNVTYLTKSDEGLHADLYVRGAGADGKLPDGISYRLSPNHVMMGGNEDLDGTITLIASPKAKPGDHQVVFVANYLHGEAREEKQVLLTFRVETPPDEEYAEEFATGDRPIPQEQVRDGRLDGAEAAAVEEDGPRETPGAAPLAGAGLAALVALVAGRRRAR